MVRNLDEARKIAAERLLTGIVVRSGIYDRNERYRRDKSNHSKSIRKGEGRTKEAAKCRKASTKRLRKKRT